MFCLVRIRVRMIPYGWNDTQGLQNGIGITRVSLIYEPNKFGRGINSMRPRLSLSMGGRGVCFVTLSVDSVGVASCFLLHVGRQ